MSGRGFESLRLHQSHRIPSRLRRWGYFCLQCCQAGLSRNHRQKHPNERERMVFDGFAPHGIAAESPTPLKRRVYWYYQGRLRWVGQQQPNSGELLSAIEKHIGNEDPDVQWAMNFTAGWIGVYEEVYRSRCVALGERTGLYKGKPVSKGCTPEYLPEFITIESNKRNL